MMYRLIALDVDGTLLDTQHRLAPETREAILQARAHGAHVCLATGKLLASVTDLIASLQLAGPQITCNGAAIMDASTGASLTSWPIPPATRQLAIASLRDAGTDLAIAWYTSDAIFTDAAPGLLDRTLAAYHEPAIRHVGRLDEHLPPALKLLITGDPTRLAIVREQLANNLGAHATVMRTTADFVETVSPDVSKGTALIALARSLGIAREEIVAIGDGENDITLLDAAGLGIAVANAMPALRPYARAITTSASELGVAHALTALGLASVGDATRLRWM